MVNGQLVKKLVGERKMKNRNIRDINGDIQIDSEEVRNRWKQYIEVLYQGPRPLEENLMKDDSETNDEKHCPYILRSKIITAVKDLKKSKSLEEKIYGEIIKALGNKAKDNLYGIIKDSCKDRRLPEEFQGSLMIAIQMKWRT
jgi:hypothetical protein